MKVIAAFVASAVSVASAATLLSTKKRNVNRSQQPLVTGTAAFNTAKEACCGCFRSKYAWPANAALGAAFAPKETCDTCYVHDVYGVASEDVEKAHKQGAAVGGTDAYETVDNSEVEGVHEWNWNCASGNAPEDESEWKLGPVEGEPAARAAFLMCKESMGWTCPSDIEDDLKLEAGADKPKVDDSEGGPSEPTVETMALPKIDM